MGNTKLYKKRLRMVKTKLTNNKPVDELQQIMTHIKNGNNFLLVVALVVGRLIHLFKL